MKALSERKKIAGTCTRCADGPVLDGAADAPVGQLHKLFNESLAA